MLDEIQTDHTPSVSLWYQSLYSGNNNNSYKMALALAIIDMVRGAKPETVTTSFRINVEDLVSCFAKRYWDHTSVFKLSESVTDRQIPKAVQMVKSYLAENGELEGVFWAKLDRETKRRFVSEFRRDQKFIQNPVSRFQCDYKTIGANGDSNGTGWLYSWDLKSGFLEIHRDRLLDIHANSSLYESLAIHAWATFLEKYNFTLKLIQKLKPDTISRNLQMFHKLMKGNFEIFSYKFCFYCSTEISGSVHLDHFVPFSYLMKDELMNLVPCCGACNSRKSDRIPVSAWLEKLSIRNKVLLNAGLFKSQLPFEDIEELDDIVRYSRSTALKAGFNVWSQLP